jgi:hypothetical protein
MNKTSILSPDRFATAKRERLLNYKTYASDAENLIARIPKADSRLKDAVWLADQDAAALMRMTKARATYALNLLALQYSAGSPIADLRALFVATVDYYESYAKYSAGFNAQQGPSYRAPHITLGDSEYQYANQLVSFAFLLGLKSTLERIAAIIDFDCPVPDGMLDRLLGVYLGGRLKPSECTKHLPYFKTLKIFDASPSEREELMAEYLEDWYTASRREPYYDSHKRGEEFRGYWSWESGAIVVALNIDDASYRDAQFYPRDLVDFARQAEKDYAPSGAPPATVNELRSKAGDPCPKAGTWVSLDVESTRRRFEFEQPMPDLASAYGLTVWRFLDRADE